MIRWSKRARKDLKRLPKQLANRIIEAVKNFYTSGRGDVRPLKGQHKGIYRLRVGEYRMLFRWIDDDIEVLKIRPRGDAY